MKVDRLTMFPNTAFRSSAGMKLSSRVPPVVGSSTVITTAVGMMYNSLSSTNPRT